MWTARHHQRWEGRQGEIGDQGLGDCRRMANSIPENIAIRVRTDGTWCKWIVNLRAPHHSHLPIRKKVLSKKSWYNIAHGKYSATTHLHLGVCTGQRQERHALFPTDSGADEAGLYQAQVGCQLLAGTTRVPGATRSGPEGTSRNA